MRALKCSSSLWLSAVYPLTDLFVPVARKPGRARGKLPQAYRVGAPSVFVTGIAWLFIVLAALASVAALLRSAEAASLLPGLQLAGDAPLSPRASVIFRTQLPWLLGIGLVLSLSTLASAIGLLLRLDWARRGFIGLLVVAIVANLAGLWLQHEMAQGLVAHSLTQAALPAPLIDLLGGLRAAARWVGALATLGTCSLLLWVIRGLMAPSVRQEFA